MSTIEQESLIYIRIPVTAMVNGAPYNPTSDTVQFAFLPDGAVAQAGDWKTASWETDTITGQYRAKCLVNGAATTGGVISLTAGSYRLKLKITDSPEIPVLEGDILVCT